MILNMEITNISWYGHANFKLVDRLTGAVIYYIDPYNFPTTLTSLETADFIFVTHAHPDHLSPNDIGKIVKKETVFVAPADCLSKLNSQNQKFPVEPNKEYQLQNIKFKTVPAYNINPQRLQAHPKANNWVGYIFFINNQKIYHAGDTDFIPEMTKLVNENLDIAMLPIGGPQYVMDVEEAIQAANAIAAKITIPMHYKALLGDKYKEAQERFKQGVTNSRVVILEEVS